LFARRIDLSSLLFFVGILLAVATLGHAKILEALAGWLNRTVGRQDVIVLLLGILSAAKLRAWCRSHECRGSRCRRQLNPNHWRAITRRGAGVPLTGLAGDLMARPRKHRRAAKAIILRLGKSWMSDRTKNAPIVVVVCLAIVVADLWIGISPD
jgi:hypothetical protein